MKGVKNNYNKICFDCRGIICEDNIGLCQICRKRICNECLYDFNKDDIAKNLCNDCYKRYYKKEDTRKECGSCGLMMYGGRKIYKDSNTVYCSKECIRKIFKKVVEYNVKNNTNKKYMSCGFCYTGVSRRHYIKHTMKCFNNKIY